MSQRDDVKNNLQKLTSPKANKSLRAARELGISLKNPEDREILRELAACYGIKLPEKFLFRTDYSPPHLKLPTGKTHNLHFIVDTCAAGKDWQSVRDVLKICRVMRKHIKDTEESFDTAAFASGEHSFSKIHYYLDIPLLLAVELTGSVNYDEIKQQRSKIARLINNNPKFIHFPTDITEHGINLGYEKEVTNRYALSQLMATQDNKKVRDLFRESADIGILLTLIQAAANKNSTEQGYVIITKDAPLREMLEALQNHDNASEFRRFLLSDRKGARLHQQMRKYPQYIEHFETTQKPLNNISIEVITPQELHGIRNLAQKDAEVAYTIFSALVGKSQYQQTIPHLLPYLMQHHVHA